MSSTGSPPGAFVGCPEFNDASVFYTTAMRILGFVAFPSNVGVLLLIVLFTPRSLGLFRWVLSLYHLFCTLLDLFLTFGTVPVLFLPFAMGYPYGVLSFPLGFPTHLLFMLIIILLVSVFISVMVQFFYRCQTILPVGHPLKLTRVRTLVTIAMFYLFLGGAVVLAAIFTNTDEYTVRSYFMDKYSCARNVLRYPRVQVYTADSLKSLLITTAVVLTLIVGLVSVFFHISTRILNTDCAHISGAMFKVHKRLIGLLYVQIALPLWLVVLPSVTMSIVVVRFTFHASTIANVCVFAFSSHGLLSSLATVYIGEYFVFVKKKALDLLGCQRDKRNVLL